MKTASSRFSLLFVALVTTLFFAPVERVSLADDPSPSYTPSSPSTDNAAPPYLGVYRWGQGGCVKGLYDSYDTWLDRRVVGPVDVTPNDSWDGIQGQPWQLGTWAPWIHKQAGRRLILSVPMLTGGWSDKGPIKGTAAGI